MQTPSFVTASRFVLAFLASSTIAAPLAIGTTTGGTTGDLVARDGLSGGCPPQYGNGCSYQCSGEQCQWVPNPPPRQRARRGEEQDADVAAKIEARSPLLGMKKKNSAAKPPKTGGGGAAPPVEATGCQITINTGSGSSFNVQARPNSETTMANAGVTYTLKISPSCTVTVSRGKLPTGFSVEGSVNRIVNPNSRRPNNQA